MSLLATSQVDAPLPTLEEITAMYLNTEEVTVTRYQECGGDLDTLIKAIRKRVEEAYFVGKADCALTAAGADESKAGDVIVLEPARYCRDYVGIVRSDFFTRMSTKLGAYLERAQETEIPEPARPLAWWQWRWLGYTQPSAENALDRQRHLRITRDHQQAPLGTKIYQDLVSLAALTNRNPLPLIFRLTDEKMPFRLAIESVECLTRSKRFKEQIGESETLQASRERCDNLYRAFAKRIQWETQHSLPEKEREVEKIKSTFSRWQWWGKEELERAERGHSSLQRQITKAQEILRRMWFEGYTGWQTVFEGHNPFTESELREVTHAFRRIGGERRFTASVGNERCFRDMYLKQTDEEGEARFELVLAHLDAERKLAALEKRAEAAKEALAKKRVEVFPLPVWQPKQAEAFEKECWKVEELRAKHRYEGRALLFSKVECYLDGRPLTEAVRGKDREYRAAKEALNKREQDLQLDAALAGAGYTRVSELQESCDLLEEEFTALERARAQRLEPPPAARLESPEEVEARVLRVQEIFLSRLEAQRKKAQELTEEVARLARAHTGVVFRWRSARLAEESDRAQNLFRVLERIQGLWQASGWMAPPGQAVSPLLPAQLPSVDEEEEEEESDSSRGISPTLTAGTIDPPSGGSSTHEASSSGDAEVLGVVQVLRHTLQANSLVAPSGTVLREDSLTDREGILLPREDMRLAEDMASSNGGSEREGVRLRSRSTHSAKEVSGTFTASTDEEGASVGTSETAPLTGAPAAANGGWFSWFRWS